MGTVNLDGQTIEYCDQYSKKNYVGGDLLGHDLNGRTIYATSFQQDVPDSEVFPSDVENLTLVKCNLDNVAVPNGATVIQCSQRRFAVQEDGFDWLLDENNNPVEKL